MLTTAIIERFRQYRSSKLLALGKVLLKIGITANIMTFFSLLAGFLAVFFLFENYFLFLLFTLLHLLCDALDGVIARVSKPTTFGKYFDHGTDCLISFLLLLKTGWFLQDYFVYIIAFLFALGVSVHFVSRFKAPMLFIRTAAFVILLIAIFPTMPYTRILLTIGYLAAGVVSVYSLARQLQWRFSK